MRTTTVRFGGTEKYRIVRVGLDVLLEILGTLESLATEVAFVRLQRNMHTNVRRDVITLDSGSTAVAPLASKIQVVGALAPNMALTDVVLGFRLATVNHVLKY